MGAQGGREIDYQEGQPTLGLLANWRRKAPQLILFVFLAGVLYWVTEVSKRLTGSGETHMGGLFVRGICLLYDRLD